MRKHHNTCGAFRLALVFALCVSAVKRSVGPLRLNTHKKLKDPRASQVCAGVASVYVFALQCP